MNMFQAELQGCRWLDLCSGSGVMGCEALEHGAERVVAVENNARIAAICRENLELVASADTQCAQVSVIRKDLLSWLKSGRPADEPAFSMVYFDPPYAAGIYNQTLELLHRCGWVQSEGLVICEHASKLRLEAPAPWIEKDRRRYGNSSLLILSPPEHSPAVLVPSSHEQSQKRDGDQAQNDSAEQGFDHGVAPSGRIDHNCSMHATHL